MNSQVDIEDHIATLKKLLEIEYDEERSRWAELRSDTSVAGRVARGDLLKNCQWQEEKLGLGGRILVHLTVVGEIQIPDSFRPGCVVQLCCHSNDKASSKSRDSSTSDADIFGVVFRTRRQSIIIALDEPPSPQLRFAKLSLELAPSDVTFKRGLTALGVIAAPANSAMEKTRDVFFGLTDAGVLGMPGFAKMAENPIATGSAALNSAQQQAYESAIQAKQLYLIHGPPGTGKSHVLAALAKYWQGADRSRGGKLLLCAASNAAVDHLLELCVGNHMHALRIGHPARIDESLHEYCLDVQVEGHESRRISKELFDEAYELLGYARKQRKQGRSKERFGNARDAAREGRRLIKEAKRLERLAVESVLADASIICSTLTGIGGRLLEGLRFDLALFDEATQSTEPMGLWPFLVADKVILAGDHHQLPPTVISRRAADELGVSVFERLMQRHPQQSMMLVEQYRMHREIMAFPSKQTYASKLIAHQSAAERDLAELGFPGLGPPLVYLDTAGRGLGEAQQPQSASYYNDGETQIVGIKVMELLHAGLSPENIGVIAPYNAQVQNIRKHLTQRLNDAGLTEKFEDLEIASVDAFQGREKEVIIVSLVRSNHSSDVGFLSDLRRMNVALTRARRHLLVIGDSATLSTSKYFNDFVEHCQSSGAYLSVWEWPGARELTD